MILRNNNIICFVTVIYCFLVDEIKTNDILCNAHDNKYWKISRNKCVECRECQSGKARNYTEEYTGKRGAHGDAGCLKCRRCKKGYYVHIPEYGGVPSTCVTCSTSCADRNRFTEKMCTAYSNWDCGGCLFGYTDGGLSNTDLPCFDQEGKAEAESQTISQDSEVTSRRTEKLVKNQHDRDIAPANTYLILLICVGGTLIIFSVIALLCFRQMKRQRKRTTSNIPTTYSQVRNEDEHMNDNDIAIDCAGESDSGRIIGLKLAQYETPTDGVRGEILPSYIGRGRELTNPVFGTETYDSLPEVCRQLAFYSRLKGEFNISEHICGCQRRCYDTSEACAQLCYSVGDVSLIGKEGLLNTISCEICHNPSEVFKALGVKDSDIYGLDDNRNRNVERITQSEFIYSVLNKWIQVNGKEARLHSLIKALCTGGFHTINHKMYIEEKYNFITLQDV